MGLITISIAAGIMPCNRTASRRRRFMRLRTTAPPSTLPTVNPDAHSAVPFAARKVKHGHVGGEMPAPLFVHALEIRVPEQAHAAREPASLPRSGPVAAAIGRECVHSTPQPRLRIFREFRKREKHYSRKPGFTDTRLRPLARRREITARPALVFIRVRNPCVFER